MRFVRLRTGLRGVEGGREGEGEGEGARDTVGGVSGWNITLGDVGNEEDEEERPITYNGKLDNTKGMGQDSPRVRPTVAGVFPEYLSNTSCRSRRYSSSLVHNVSIADRR